MNKIYIKILSFLMICSLGWTETQAVTLVNEAFTASPLPSGWSSANVNHESGAGGYYKFAGNTGEITSPAFTTWSNYENINIAFSVAKFGSATNGPLTLDVSNDGGATWTAFTADSPTPTSSTYVSASINIPNGILTSNMRIRLTSANSPSEKRFRNLNITGDLKALCSAPGTSTSDFNTNSVASTNSIDLEWLDGNGAGRVIKMNTTNSFTNLSDNSNPTASTVYTSGEQVVYNGTGSGPITITGLLPNTTYYFKGYEYCSPDRVYNNSGVVENITTDVGSNIILTESSTYGPFCSGNNQIINVAFDKVGTFNGEFKVQISDANGIFSTNPSENIIGSGSASPIVATIPSSTPAGTGYRVRVINADPITFGDDNGSNIVINTIPTIPTSTVPSPACEGNSISVIASGSTNALSYTFWDAATGGNQVTTGVSGNTLTLDNNTPAGSYTYYIQAENGTCVSDRQSVALEINEVPSAPTGSFSYSNNPSCGPATIDFPSGYYFQTTANGTSTANPTSSSYILNTSGTVYVRAHLGSCWSEEVASAIVSISNPVNITSQPANVSISENGSGTIDVIANNVSAYQWQKNDGCGWSNITGAITNTITILSPNSSQNGELYRVLLEGQSTCSDVISNVATLTVTSSTSASSEVIWSNPITGTNPGNENPYTTGDISNSNIIVTGIGSSGVEPNDANDRYNKKKWNTTEIDLNNYFTWSLTAKPGHTISLSSLESVLRRSSSGPNKLQLRTSIDNFSETSEISFTSTSSSGLNFVFPLSISNISFVEIRLYAYGATAETGTISVNDFEFNGSITEVCTPPTIIKQPNPISPCYKTMSVETSSPSATYQWEIKTPSSTQYERILSCTPNAIGGQTSQLEIIGTIPVGTKYRVKVTADNCTAISDSIEYTGNASVSLSHEVGDIILDADPCDANGWTYYSSASNPGQYLFAINWAPSGTISASNQNAKDVAQVMISLNNDFFSNEDVINGDHFATYTMKRYWNVDAISFDEPVNVIFPYLNSEIQEIVDAAQNYVSNQVGSRYEGFKWFKIEGQSFEPISSIVTPVNIINSIPLTDVASTSNNITYAQFNGITSFSGGTGATGVGPLINDPLPVELLYFNASCQNSSLTLDWATASEKNADKFIVEGSNDGIAFENIGSVLAYGNSNSLKEYEYKVNEPKHKYYRLLQIDFDGTQEYFKIVSVPCDLSQNMIAARYASNEGIIVEIQSSKNKEMTLTLTSINGQNILNQKIDVQAGSQRLVLSTEKLPKGIYIISVGDAYQQQTSKLSVY